MNWIPIDDMTLRLMRTHRLWLLRTRSGDDPFFYFVHDHDGVRALFGNWTINQSHLAALPDSPSASTPSRAEVLAENGVHEVQLPPELVVKSVDRDAGTISVGPGKTTEFEQGDSISIVTEDPEYIIDGETVRASELDLTAPDGYFWEVNGESDESRPAMELHCNGETVNRTADVWWASGRTWWWSVEGSRAQGTQPDYRAAMDAAQSEVVDPVTDDSRCYVRECGKMPGHGHGHDRGMSREWSQKSEDSTPIEPDSDEKGTEPTLQQLLDDSKGREREAVRQLLVCRAELRAANECTEACGA